MAQDIFTKKLFCAPRRFDITQRECNACGLIVSFVYSLHLWWQPVFWDLWVSENFVPLKSICFSTGKVIFDLYWEEFSHGSWHIQNFYSFIFQVTHLRIRMMPNIIKANKMLALLVYVYIYTFCEPQTLTSNSIFTKLLRRLSKLDSFSTKFMSSTKVVFLHCPFILREGTAIQTDSLTRTLVVILTLSLPLISDLLSLGHSLAWIKKSPFMWCEKRDEGLEEKALNAS